MRDRLTGEPLDLRLPLGKQHVQARADPKAALSDAEVTAILGEGRFVLCTGLDREDRLRLQEAAPERRAMLQLSNGPLLPARGPRGDHEE